jgi:anaerobic magnesium-protoporphyrin IX monomethyl ester cyclase
MLKVLLNSPCNYTTSSELLTVPIGLAYIKRYCEINFPCAIAIVPFLDEKTLEQEKPDIVGISCFAATYGKAVQLARQCKLKGIWVVVGGEQITTLPHLVTDDMDVGVRGEGEFIFLELLRSFDNGWKNERLQHIKGIVFRDEQGEMCIKDPVPSVLNLDQLPIPDLLLDDKETDLLCLMTSRGCPYKCVFCATGWHNSVHWMSPERLVETIEFHVNKYPQLRRVKFWDDLFTVRFKRVERIVELLEKRGLTRRLSFMLCTRADHIKEPLLTLLQRMNCQHISMGLESGCDATLKYINKQCSAKTNRTAVELLSEYGFDSESSFIIGFPHETEEDVRETYAFIKQIPIDKIQVFLPIPYPGTALWEYASGKGLVSENMKWEKLDLIATMADPKSVLTDSVVLSETLTRMELYLWLKRFNRLRKWKTFIFALRLFVKDPRVILQRLRREVRFFIRKVKLRRAGI